MIDGEHTYGRSAVGDGFPLEMWSNRWSSMPIAHAICIGPFLYFEIRISFVFRISSFRFLPPQFGRRKTPPVCGLSLLKTSEHAYVQQRQGNLDDRLWEGNHRGMYQFMWNQRFTSDTSV